MTAKKSLPASLFAGRDEDAAAAAPRLAAWKEAVATAGLCMLPLRPDMTTGQAADVVSQAVEAGLDSLASDSPGLIGVGGQSVRDQLELLCWRIAAGGGWHIKPENGEAAG